MKMLRNLGWGILALALAYIPTAAEAAQYGYKISAVTILDVTTTACTITDNETVDMFGNGADMDQIWALQREIGSPGTGIWEAVAGLKDIFPTASSAITQVARYVSSKPHCYRLLMTKDDGGTGQLGLVTDRSVGTDTTMLSYQDYVVKFDDFHGTVLGIAALGSGDSDWISFEGATGGASGNPAIEEASPEGIMTFTSGSDDDGDDAIEVTYGANAFSALISDGLTIIECRSALDAVAASQFACGLTEDFAVDGEEDMEHVIGAGTITDETAVSSGISIMFSTDATTDVWQAVSTNATNIGNAAAEYTLGSVPVAGEYDRLRIEINALGHAFFYINNLLMGVEPLAVATAALMQPWLGVMTTTSTLVKVDTDYVLFVAPRPSGT